MSLEKVIDDKISDLLMKIDKQKLPKHVAIIMDGNGRWATRKGCLLYTSPSPRDRYGSRMPSSA